MTKHTPLLVTVALAALLPLSTVNVAATEALPNVRLAMMDMMPSGGGEMSPSAPGAMPQAAPGGGMRPGMGDDKMPMGGGMPAQGQNQMPTGQMAPQQPMGGCPPMMQNMMRMGGGQPGMPQMQSGAGTGGGTGMGMMGGGTPSTGSSAARLEGRIAFLRAELHITDAQAATWDGFATALRAGREHLDAARAALQDSSANPDPMARLKSFENHLTERAEAMHTTEVAFNTLYGQLDDSQKRVATATMLPFIGAF